MKSQRIHTIVLYPRLQVDTIGAVFLLRTFGEEAFPGVSKAQLEFWNKLPLNKTAEQLEGEGYLVIDIGKGRFDHHREDYRAAKETASTLIGKYLGVREFPSLKKFFAFVKRDDLEGKGIISKDLTDRAFGLPAIIRNLSRDYPKNSEFVVEMIYRIYLAQFHEEYRRKVLMPRQWKSLLEQGKARLVNVSSADKTFRIALVESDSETIPGFLRAVKDIMADIVIQRRSTKHTNVITNQNSGKVIDMRLLVQALRRAEALKKGLDLNQYSKNDLERPGALSGLEEWFYDDAANTIQNGGIDPKDIPATRLSLDEICLVFEKVIPKIG